VEKGLPRGVGDGGGGGGSNCGCETAAALVYYTPIYIYIYIIILLYTKYAHVSIGFTDRLCRYIGLLAVWQRPTYTRTHTLRYTYIIIHHICVYYDNNMTHNTRTCARNIIL